MSLLEHPPSATPAPTAPSTGRSPPAGDTEPRPEAARRSSARRPRVGRRHRRTVGTGGRPATTEALLELVARGDQVARVALEDRIGGLVRVNVRRTVRDAARAEAVSRRVLDEILADAVHFDPLRDSAQSWLLTRANQHALASIRGVDVTATAPGPDLAPPDLAPPVRHRWARPTSAGGSLTPAAVLTLLGAVLVGSIGLFLEPLRGVVVVAALVLLVSAVADHRARAT